MPRKFQRASIDQIETWCAAQQHIYKLLLKQISEVFDRIFDTWECDGKIYRIYSRADKQRGRLFKDSWKIRFKVNQARKGNAKFQIGDVIDLVGMTIVVSYPSDAEIICKIIDSEIDNAGLISFLDAKRRKHGPKYAEIKSPDPDSWKEGYYAYHYILGIPIVRNLSNARCEVQVKTLLHDAWSAKTHDLTYKPSATLDGRLQAHIQSVGRDMELIEQRSELLKELIDEDRKIEEIKRSRALQLLMHSNPRDPDRNFRRRFKGILKKALTNRDSLSATTINTPECSSLLGKIDQLRNDFGFNRDVSRLYSLLSSITGNKQIFDLAMENLDEWYSHANSVLEQIESLKAKGFMLFWAGMSVEAILETERALQLLPTARDRQTIGFSGLSQFDEEAIFLNNNLAYYYSDIMGSDASIKLGGKSKAQKSIAKAIALLRNAGINVKKIPPDIVVVNCQGDATVCCDIGLEILETYGATTISCAKSQSDLYDGLEACAYVRMQRQTVARLQYEKEHAQAMYDIQDFRVAVKRLEMIRQETDVKQP